MWRWIVAPRFDWLQIEVSASCNAACHYCPVGRCRATRSNRFIDEATFSKLEQSFSSADLVFLQGWGEPPLHPNFWSMVRRVKATGTRVGFATNGVLLGGEHLRYLLDSKVDVVAVSLAGTCEATHERFRKGCDFKKIDSALRTLKRHKRDLRQTHLAVHIAFILLRSNWQELDELPRIASEWGVSQVVVSNLSLVLDEQLQRESLLLDSVLWLEARSRLDAAREEAARCGVSLHYYEPDLSRWQPICPENVLRSCFISYRGDVAPCVMTNFGNGPEPNLTYRFGDHAYPPSQVIFGNVNHASLPDIWRSEAAKTFRNGFQHRLQTSDPGLRNLPEPCSRCYKLFERCST